MENAKLIQTLGFIEKLKSTTRHSWTSENRHESVAEHSWRLALMAYFVKDEFPDVDIDKVILMCLMHDFGEIVTGDIPAFYKTQEDENVEEDAISGIINYMPAPFKDEMRSLFDEMLALQTKEAKLVKALDKLETLVSHNEADISTWLELEYTENLTYGEKECSFSDYTASLKEYIKQISIDKMKKEGNKNED